MKFRFPTKSVYVKQIESLFEQLWARSHESTETLTFDFSSVDYMDLMQICQVFLWIEKLLIEKKRVDLNFQRVERSIEERISKLFSVCNSYGFFAELSKYENLSITPNPASYYADLPGSRFDAPLIHLTRFETHRALDEFLSKEDFHEPAPQLTSKAPDPISISLRTEVRNIVLREVADNVFTHAGGVPAILAVSRKTRTQLAYSRNPDPIKDFARRSAPGDYIQIIVGDFGVGIPSKLLPKFKDDPDASKYFKNSTDAFNVIEYSFWKDSSSRRRDIEEAIDAEVEIDEATLREMLPPTGLFFVQQLAERHRGMIVVRAADTIWCRDYTLEKEQVVRSDAWGVTGFTKLPGNVIQIILPVQSRQDNLRLDERKPTTISRPINFSTYIAWDQVLRASSQDERAAVLALIKQTRTATILGEVDKGILIDLRADSLSSKRLFQIAVHLMYFQDDRKQIVLVNAPLGESWNEVCRQIENLRQKQSLHPVYWVSVNEQGVLGGRHGDLEHAQPVSESDVQKFVLDAIRVSVTKTIRSTFHEDAKVFLPAPSSRYIKGFFHLPEVLDDKEFCNNFVSLITEQVKEKRFVAAVTTSSRLIDLAKMFASELRFSLSNVFYQAGDRPGPGLFLDLVKLPHGDVLVLSDAVVTGHTVSWVKRFIPNEKEAVVVALVKDASQDDVTAPVRHPFATFERKPRDWDYDEIRPISSATHQFVEGLPPSKEEHVTEQILRQWADSDRAVALGHFSYEHTCYPIFFDTVRLYQIYSDGIFEFIRGDLTRNRHHIWPESSFTFGFPANNKGAESICDQLSKYLGGRIDYVTKSGAVAYEKENHNQVFVFIDMAASTTRTMRRAMEHASQRGYAALQIYIVINRSQINEYEFIKGIHSFKKVDVRIKSQFRVELPAFESRHGCPTCLRKARLEEEARKSIPASCRMLLQEEAHHLKLIPIQEARDGGYDLSPDFRAGYGKALAFRQVLEIAGTDNTLASTAKLLTLISELTDMSGGIACLIDVLWLEVDAIRKNPQYGRLWDKELSEALIDSCLSELYLGNSTNRADRKALWAAAGIDFTRFLDSIDVDAWRITEGACSALVSAIFYYRQSSTDDKSIQLLRQVSTHIEANLNGAFRQEIVTALREAANSLDLGHTVDLQDLTQFNKAVEALSAIFHQKGSSHPQFRKMFDEARRLVDEEDLATCLEHAKLKQDSLFNVFKRDLLPALKTLVYALPETILAEAPYVANLTVANDLASFVADLEIASNAHSAGSLKSEAWEGYKRTIKEATARILEQFIQSDTSELQYLLTRCECRIDNILQELDTTISRISSNRLVLPTSDVQSVCMPSDVVRDLCKTVIDNAMLYGEEGRDVICELSDASDVGVVIFETRSVPKENCWPTKKPNHGLSRVAEILERYGGWLRLPMPQDKTETCNVAIGFPIKWSST